MKNKLSIISFDKEGDPKATAVRNYSLTNSSMPPHPSLSFEYPLLPKGMILGICLQGNAKLKIDLREYTLIPNSIFTILPNQIFEPIEKTDDHYTEILFFSIDFINSIPLPKDFDVMHRMKNCPCLPISEENMDEVVEYYSFISKALENKKHIHKEEIRKSLLYALIALIGSLYIESEAETELKVNSRGENIVEEFSKLLMKYHRKERNASFYADKLCISTQYLSRTLKKITGRSVNIWITEAVILEARILLKSSNMTVLQISEELNFPNPSFFVRYFKQYSGMTPSKYRER